MTHIEQQKWRDARETLLKTAQENPGILLDVIDSAYLAGLDFKLRDMSEKDFEELEQNIRDQHEKDLNSLIDYLRSQIIKS